MIKYFKIPVIEDLVDRIKSMVGVYLPNEMYQNNSFPPIVLYMAGIGGVGGVPNYTGAHNPDALKNTEGAGRNRSFAKGVTSADNPNALRSTESARTNQSFASGNTSAHNSRAPYVAESAGKNQAFGNKRIDIIA